MNYVGQVVDAMGILPARITRKYKTYELAYKAAEKLCNRTYGVRGLIRIYLVCGENPSWIRES